MAKERKMTVDIDGFDVEMKNQKELAKSGQKFEMDNLDLKWNLETKSSHSIFVGYENESISSKIINHAKNGDDIIIILENTPFYSESGGQIGDAGIISNDDFSARVNDTQKNGDYVLHICSLTNGAIGNNLSVDCMIDVDRRNNIKINHTATHLLHQSLKDVLGDHVNQAGSLVHPEYLRFDITHPKKISLKELEDIELIVNQKIGEDITVETSIKSLEEAKKEGATALFGEKYEDEVRVVTMGKFSKELCGGTHVSSTGKINKFKIKHDKAISSGIRRINAITHNEVDLYLKQKSEELGLLKEAEKKKEEEKQSQSILLNNVDIDSIIKNPIMDFDGIELLFSKVELGVASDLKTVSKKIKNKVDSAIIFLFTEIDKKITISISITDDLIAKSFHAGKLVKFLASELNGRGGGKEDFAMAGIPYIHPKEINLVAWQLVKRFLEKKHEDSFND